MFRVRRVCFAAVNGSCRFQKLVGGVCASDKRYEGAVIVPLSSCQKDILGHTRSVGVSDISPEIELILARASIFSPPRDISSWTICPSHRSSLALAGVEVLIDAEYHQGYQSMLREEKRERRTVE